MRLKFKPIATLPRLSDNGKEGSRMNSTEKEIALWSEIRYTHHEVIDASLQGKGGRFGGHQKYTLAGILEMRTTRRGIGISSRKWMIGSIS